MTRRIGRRELLVTSGAVVCAQKLGCGGITLPLKVDAGPASKFALPSLQEVGGTAVAVGRDANGLYAMTLVCTHSGCDMTGGVSLHEIDCGCHGSVFNGNGVVLRGPATTPLQHFAIELDASGNVIIHTDQPVAASARTAVSQ
jgi:cytochrome b6-f complex iron-sulfur subunit